ncbi:carboxypeptidase-like regulatory domain-containing protein [Polaribacter porphyrae]|uniref:Carboxypeptidase-like regulatory domain-containing protein n=1 Tax=Polaribacter porphyrae TaxID=1137780 RepID=A0A2S7WLT3_9FLAO|nr:carboxypeptidase-like regulatory domain-containing protein [Polaribacter porphyrae]PQJ78557.1 hypothetical protein BTO18_04860 [Polaribacter porphyrae]
MKKQLITYFLFFVGICFSQQSKKLIHGYIIVEKTAISNVHVINKSSNIGTITNDFGWFEIPVSLDDTLQFTHVNFETKEIKISKDIFIEGKINITLKEKVYILEEIVLEKPKSIFHIDKDILPPPKVNAKTLRLPYANTKPKKDKAIVKFRSGGVVNLDNLINAINGNNRREKMLKKITYEDKVLSEIRKYFTDDFFITDLNIKKENINPFLNYCFKKGIINLFNKKQNIILTKVLMKESKVFPQKIKTEVALINKN